MFKFNHLTPLGQLLGVYRSLIMVSVVALHLILGWLWAHQTKPPLSLGSQVSEMMLEFSALPTQAAATENIHVNHLEATTQVLPEISKPVLEAVDNHTQEASHIKQAFVPQIQSASLRPTNVKYDRNSSLTTHTKDVHAETISAPATVSIHQLSFDGKPPAPKYPRQARMSGHEGLVVVRISIDRSGGVQRSRVVLSSGFDSLDEAAMDAASLIRFKPYQVNSVTQSVVADMPFNFILSP